MATPQPHAFSKATRHARGRALAWRLAVAVVAALVVGAIGAGGALADAPTPTSVHVESYAVHGSDVTVTVSGTWSWPTMTDCNNQRVGAGYAVSWGDNTANALKKQGTEPTVYVGTATDDWVHSVTVGAESVAGPFKAKSGGGFEETTVAESMLGETPEAMFYGYGDEQGISTGASSGNPTAANAAAWRSNCGPTKPTKFDGVTIGNSEPTNPTQGHPSGSWGPISHTYTTPGTYKICPVMYDPHGHEVGEAAGSVNEITAGANGTTSSYNGDNSIEGNGGSSGCGVTVTLPTLTTSPEPAAAFTGQTLRDAATINGTSPKGTLVWKLYGPFASSASITSASCTGTPAYDGSGAPVTVNGNGTYQGPSTKQTAAGVYQWVASYSSSNAENESIGPVGCGETSEQVTLSPPPSYSNVASIEGNEGTGRRSSNRVTVKIATEASYTIEKEQKLSGEANYVKSELLAKVGQTVDYAITVRNTGNAPLTFSGFKDEHCEAVTGGPSGVVEPGATATWTCVHKLTAAGKYVNEASVEGSEGTGRKTSNKVTVNASLTASFNIEKLQRVERTLGGPGGDEPYTASELYAYPEEYAAYEIVVKNTGEVPLTFKEFTDPNCTGVSGGPGTGAVQPNASTIYYCSHKFTASGQYLNEASVVGSEGTGKETSNTVRVVVVGKPVCSTAPAGFPNLGQAAQYSMFALNGTGEQRIELGIQEGIFQNDTLNGAVGVGPKAQVTNGSSSTINGNVYVDKEGHFEAAAGKVNGKIMTGQNLFEAHIAARVAAEEGAKLKPNFTYGNVTSGVTIEGGHGLNVVDINGEVNLNSQSITLKGPGDAWFIVNIKGGITLNGTGGILLQGVNKAQVLINAIGSRVNVTSHVGNKIEGTLLAVEASANGLDGTFGSLLLGGNFTLADGMTNNFTGCTK